jgi:hypothetical protein
MARRAEVGSRCRGRAEAGRGSEARSGRKAAGGEDGARIRWDARSDVGM